MDAQPAALEPFTSWRSALDRTADAARVIVIGATDAGKSSFVTEALAVRGRELALLDRNPVRR